MPRDGPSSAEEPGVCPSTTGTSASTVRPTEARPSLHRLSDSFDRDHFNDIADLDVIETFERDAAFQTRFDFTDVVFESAQRGQAAGPDDDVVAQETRLRVAGSGDAAVDDETAGDRADLRRFENLTNFGRADARFFQRRLEQPGHRLLNLVGDVVDD